MSANDTATLKTPPRMAVESTALLASPVRIILSRKKGYRMPPNSVKVDRTTKWGNPFRIGEKNPFGTTTQDARHSYNLFCGFAPQNKKLVDAAQAELKGKNLACWCKQGQPCHADVLLDLANDQAQPLAEHNKETK
jgi:hypothetical protein